MIVHGVEHGELRPGCTWFACEHPERPTVGSGAITSSSRCLRCFAAFMVSVSADPTASCRSWGREGYELISVAESARLGMDRWQARDDLTDDQLRTLAVLRRQLDSISA